MAEKTKDAVKQSHKAALKAVELAKAEVELAALKVDLEMDTHRLDNYRDEKKKKKNEDSALGIFSLETGVGNSVLKLAQDIRTYGRANPGKPITLNIFSPGGSIFHGIVLYDALRTLSSQGHPITTVARGYAASMGSILFLAGDTRIIGTETYLMFHALSTMVAGSLHEIEDETEFCKRLNARLDKIITSRTKITAAMLKKKSHKTDWWVDPETAIELRVAHKIL
jgi:ATP-dependent Clp protease protease subunit